MSDRFDFPQYPILGVGIHAATLTQALDAVDNAIRDKQRLMIGVVNAAKIVNMRKSVELSDDVNGCGARLEDAVRWNNAWLFATSAGLRTYDFAEKTWTTVDLAVDGSAVRVLALDGAGCLWLAGAGLWVVVRDRAVDLSSLPPLAGVDVIAMIADPHRREGVIVSLGDRGLLYVATE